MSSVSNERDRLLQQVRDGLRELRRELARLNHRVGDRVKLRDLDLDCYDLIAQSGSITPGALAAAAGIHPATMTGVLDRLERGGWIVRDRAAGDRRSVVLRPAPRSAARLVPHFQGMSDAVDASCAGYTNDELRLVVDFLARAARAGDEAAADLERRPA